METCTCVGVECSSSSRTTRGLGAVFCLFVLTCILYKCTIVVILGVWLLLFVYVYG